MLVSAENPSIFISPQLAEQAHEGNITGMTVNTYGLSSTVNTATGGVKPHVGALVLQGRGERASNPDLFHLPDTGIIEGAPMVELDEVAEAIRAEQLDQLRVRPHVLTLEGLRKAVHIAADKWHAAPGAWDESLFMGLFSGGVLGLATDIIYRGVEFDDFSSLREKALATAAGVAVGAAGVTPLFRSARYRFNVRNLRGYPIQLQQTQT